MRSFNRHFGSKMTAKTLFNPHRRLQVYSLCILFAFGGIIARLFYWQILAGENLHALAETQRQSTSIIPAIRGEILANDGFPLVSNQPAYLVFAYMPDLKTSVNELVATLVPLLKPTAMEIGATPSAKLEEELSKQTQQQLLEKLTQTNVSWIPLKRQITQSVHDQIKSLNIKGIGFDSSEIRAYPEASMAAQALGFVGSNGTGNPKGYFGIEGYYDLELTGKPGLVRQEKDVSGRPIVIGEYESVDSRPGRSLKTHLDRSLQLLIETELAKGIKQYEAVSGEVTLIDPFTGAILAMASYPSYDPAYYKLYPSQVYKIPSISDVFEPGSIFKPLVMAAAINEGVVTPTSLCDDTCNGPVTIGKYTIRTWNDQYIPNQTMTDVLRHSDNTGMIYAANRLGKDKFVKYLEAFGFGQPTGIDLESETIPSLRTKWGDIDLATGSFGQGIAVTSMQMLQAISAIANGGELVTPKIVDEVITQEERLPIKTERKRRVISKETAKAVTTMMVASANQGEAQWAFKDGSFQIAGKTGTAQIPIQGHYDTEKTIASFIGFAPAYNPRFVMLVKLTEPKTSPWASETAAPLWMTIARFIFSQYLNNQPTQSK